MSEDLYANVMMTEAPDTRTPFDVATARVPTGRRLEPTGSERARPAHRDHRVRERRRRRAGHGRARVRRPRQRRPDRRAAERVHAPLRRVLRLAAGVAARGVGPIPVAAAARGAGRTGSRVPRPHHRRPRRRRPGRTTRRRHGMLRGDQPDPSRRRPIRRTSTPASSTSCSATSGCAPACRVAIGGSSRSRASASATRSVRSGPTSPPR